MGELIGYACAWKRGCNDDISGMTRSAYLWRSGECYCWDDAADNWMSHACASPASGRCDGSGGAAGASAMVLAPLALEARTEALDSIEPIAVSPERSEKQAWDARTRIRRLTVSATPPSGTEAAAFEVQVPKGWIVSNIGSGGTWDEVHRKVKWGPVLGDSSVALSFQVRAVRGGAGIARFIGTASFDGMNHRFVVR
jgi:hypothetical protein